MRVSVDPARIPRPVRLPEQIGVDVDRSRRVDVDIEDARFGALRVQLDVVRTGLDGQALERAVEIVHDAG